MPEKRRTRATTSRAKAQRTPVQTNLRNLFQRTQSDTGSEKTQESQSELADPVVLPVQAADSQTPGQPSKPCKPSQLYPIFTKVSSVQENPPDEVISVDDTDVVPVDITDISPEVELSTEPPSLSTHHVTPCSEFSQATSHSPPPSPIARDVDCSESDTSSWHAGTRERPHLHTANKIKESHKRTLGPGDVAALPSSCSQHVRGLQHSYTCGQAPPKRSICSSSCPPGEGTLDFLTKLRQLDDTPSIPLARICRSLTWTPQQCEEHLQSLSRDYIESHPAFAQILVQRGRIPLRHSTETWTRRFRPRRANEVLGNEQQALYLRDWLRALELRSQDCQLEEPASQRARENKDKGTSRRIPRGTKRPRVVRAVTRKRSKKKRVASDDDLDDFVVFSDVDEEETDDPPEDSEDELAFCQRTLSRLHRRGTSDIDEGDPIALKVPVTATNHAVSPSLQRAQANFTDNLTNTILITGPPGCGKTAAVYACAEELGWEVFEVYPGIGRRNGASLDHLVGDVGKNHIVQTVHRRAVTKARVGLDGYLAKGKARQLGGISKTQEAGTEGQPITVEDGSPTHAERPLPQDREMGPSDETGISGTCQEESQGSRPNVRQSLVLLEEVDILFKDDAGFWPAVVEFIQNCQRPVVMTCNDAGLVPVGELPLQKVLVFEPCASPVAATFLQCVSLAEGCLVPHEDLVVLYESTHAIDGLDTPDAPLYPRTEPLPLPDLRRCITQLQILCAGTRQGSASEKHQGDEAGGHARRSARAISAGSRDESEWWWQMKRESELMSHVDAELCRTGVGTRETVCRAGDEETGYVMLGEGEGEGEGGLYCGRDELIGEEAVRHARGTHEGGTGPMEASINPAARLTREGFRARVAYQARMVEALGGVLAPPALVPQRRVFVDYIPWVRNMVLVDDAQERGGVRRGRCTRNSLGYARAVGLSEEQRGVVRAGL